MSSALAPSKGAKVFGQLSRTGRAHRSLRPLCAVEQVAAPPTSSRSGPKRPEDLVDAAQIGAKGKASARVKDRLPPASLTDYMLLPVEQYFVLDPKQIKHLGGNRFILYVPRIQIFNVWLEPEVEISVTTTPTRVVLKAENCRIKGSDLIENLQLDQRFCMRFTTELTWGSDPMRPNPETASASSSGSSWDDGQGAPTADGWMEGNAQLDVWCEVIPPFHLMPRPALISSCNVVMSGLVNTLLPLFMRRLAADFKKWSEDPAYRAHRAASRKPLERAAV